MFRLVKATILRWRARAAYARVPRRHRFRTKELARQCINECDCKDELEVLEFVSNQLDLDQQAKFGIAEILIMVELIWLLYQIAQKFGWLKSASTAIIERELGE